MMNTERNGIMPDNNRIIPPCEPLKAAQSDLRVVNQVVQKMDSTLDKLQDIASDLGKVAALQEHKNNIQDKINDALEKSIKDHNQEIKENLRELDREFEKKTDSLKTAIDQVSAERREGYTNLSGKVEATEDRILKEIENLKDSMSKRMYEMDMWRYGVMGAIVLGSFLITKFIDVAKLFR